MSEKRGRGQPKFEPTPDQRSRVKLMKALGIPEDQICKTITNPRTGKPVAPMTSTMRLTMPNKSKVMRTSRSIRVTVTTSPALPEIRGEGRSSVIVIAADPAASTNAGGAWWEVAVPAVSDRAEVATARAAYDAARTHQRAFR